MPHFSDMGHLIGITNEFYLLFLPDPPEEERPEDLDRSDPEEELLMLLFVEPELTEEPELLERLELL